MNELNSGNSVITIKNLTKSFLQENKRHYVLNNINLTINIGEFVSIYGSNGSGKTTFLKTFGSIDKPDSGKIEINSGNYNPSIKMIFQNFQHK